MTRKYWVWTRSHGDTAHGPVVPILKGSTNGHIWAHVLIRRSCPDLNPVARRYYPPGLRGGGRRLIIRRHSHGALIQSKPRGDSIEPIRLIIIPV